MVEICERLQLKNYARKTAAKLQ